MKKTYITLLICIIGIISLVLLNNLEVLSKDIVAKITLFLTSIIAFILSYIIGIKKNKNGLTNGLIVGISIAVLSLIIHYFLKTLYFDIFYVRGTIFMISGACGGIIGVNTKKETF